MGRTKPSKEIRRRLADAAATRDFFSQSPQPSPLLPPLTQTQPGRLAAAADSLLAGTTPNSGSSAPASNLPSPAAGTSTQFSATTSDYATSPLSPSVMDDKERLERLAQLAAEKASIKADIALMDAAMKAMVNEGLVSPEVMEEAKNKAAEYMDGGFAADEKKVKATETVDSDTAAGEKKKTKKKRKKAGGVLTGM